jgi:rubrerythrin
MGAMWGSFQAVLEFVREQPTVGTVKRGKWINQSPFDWKCSVCGYEVEQYIHFKYCPNCGAKMESDNE